MLVQLLANGLITSCAYALIALGFGLIYNTVRIFHFAHGAVYTLSVYIFYAVYVIMDWPIILAAALALMTAAAAGVLIDELIYRPLIERGASALILMLSSIGLYIVIINLIALVYGNENKVLSSGLQSSYVLGPAVVTKIQLIMVLSFIMLFGFLVPFLRKTNLGRVIRAMRDDPELLSALGINPRTIRRAVFALGSTLSAVAAILLGFDVGIDPNVGMMAMLRGAVIVIIGGVGVFEGAALGALALGILESVAIWQVSARWSDPITFIIFIFFLLFRPEGMLGQRRRVEEMSI
jgi:branched-chain amino acid transport system permease protein